MTTLTGSLPSLVARWADIDPDHVAVVDDDRQLTYGELNREANRLAHQLIAAGVSTDVPVGVCLPRSIDFVIAALAAVKAGGAYLPLDPQYPLPRLAAMLRVAGPPVIVTRGELADRLPVDRGAVVLIEEAARAGYPDDDPKVTVNPDDLAYLMFTSGSSGEPKGVMVPHRGIVSLVVDADYVQLGPDEIMMHMSSVSFDAATFDIWGALTNGARLVVGPAQLTSMADLGARIRRHGVTTMFMTTGLFHLMVDEQLDDLRGLRQLLTGGDVMAPDRARRVVRELPGCRLINLYGPTENTVVITAFTVTPDWAGGESVPIGRPIRGTYVRVLDAAGEPATPGQPGQLFSGGVGLARGYLGDAARTADRFVPDPAGAPGARLYATGDLVRARVDGVLEFLGRVDQQVKIRGHRVEPGEIEQALRGHDRVRDAAVLATGATVEDRRLVAYLALTDTADAPPNIVGPPNADDLVDQVRRWAATRLPPYLVPELWVALDALPLTTQGKVDRQALASLAGSATAVVATRSDGELARTPTERDLAERYGRLLGAARVRRDDDFMALGGHSLAAVRLAAEIRRDTGHDLSLADIYAHGRVADLAALLDTRGPASPRADAGLRGRPGRRVAPLSAAQEALRLLHLMYPTCTAYHVPTLHEIDGVVDVIALRTALAAVIARHAALRTTLPMVNGRAVQQVSPPEASTPDTVALAVLDLTDASGSSTLTQHAQEELHRPFDLTAGPLFRATLFQLGPQRHALLLVGHHIIIDGWSLEVIHRDLGVAYTAAIHGVEPSWTPLPLQFVDVAAAEAGAGHQALVAAETAYWTSLLADLPPALELPFRGHRPNQPRFRGDRVTATVPPETTSRLRALARRGGVPLSATLYAGLSALLGRYTGATDFLIGTPVAGRDHAELDDVVGFFNNSLVLRCQLPTRGGFEALVGATHQMLRDALSHRHVPFSELVTTIGPRRVPGANPLFQIWCNLLSYDRLPMSLPGCQVRAVAAPLAGSLFDLTFYLTEHPDRIELEVVYDSDLYDRDRVEAMATHYVAVLDAGSGHSASVESWLDEIDNVAVAREFAPLSTEPVARRFHTVAADGGARVALRHAGTTIDYATLAERVRALVDQLRAHDLGDGDLLAVNAGRTPHTVIAILAALSAEVPFLLLDEGQPQARRDRMVAAARPTAWFDPDTGDITPGSGGRRLAPHTAYATFTSGTTGTPKGIVAGERPLRAFLDWYTSTYDLSPDDRYSMISGIGHDPLLREILAPLTSGAAVCVPPVGVAESPVRLLRWLAAEGVTVIHLTPAVGRLLAAAAQAERASLAAVRLVGFGGAAVTEADHRHARTLFPHARLLSFYGATETPQVVAALDLAEEYAVRRVHRVPAIAAGSPPAQLLVVTADGRPAPVNAVGEIVVRSPYLADGYLDDPDRTAQRFSAELPAVPQTAPPAASVRRYRTGDLGCRRPDGAVAFLGRIDRQLSINGLRVEPSELEYVAREHPRVDDCVVLADGSALIAYVQPAPAGVTVPEVRHHLVVNLPPGMTPTEIILVPDLPLSANGKPDLDRLRTMRAARSVTPVSRDADLTTALTQVWQSALGVSTVGPDDNFFDLGGTSVTLLAVHARLADLVPREIALTDLFRFTTPRELANYLTDRG